MHALSLRRDYVKKFVLTNDVADILCRVHCPLSNPPPPPSPLCCVQPRCSWSTPPCHYPFSPSVAVMRVCPWLPFACAYVCHGRAPLCPLPNELLFASATIDNGIMTCDAPPSPLPPYCLANCSVIILQSFAKWTRLNKSSDRGQLYDKSNCKGIT